jgi:hypothetical protein
MWIYLDAFVASAYHVFFASNTANNDRRLIASGASAGELQFTISNLAGGTLVNTSGAAGMPTGAWTMLVHLYDDSSRLMLPIKNGYAVLKGQVAGSSPAAALLDENFTMAKGSLSNRTDGKQSRTWMRRGTFTPAQLAKLYDLGMGSG